MSYALQFLYLVYNYKQPRGPGACCIAPRQFHRRCHIRDEDVSVCRTLCNEDPGCKGYVEKTSKSHGCQIATTSDCPAGSKKVNAGNVGDLDANVNCFSFASYGYVGCFIKQSGVLTV